MTNLAVVEHEKQFKPSPIEKYWTLDQAKIIQSVIAPGLTSDELVVFAHICQKANLDPFAKQIYAIKRAGRMCVQTGIDGFRLVAERTGKYAPGGDTKFIYDDKGKLLGATVYIKKLTQDGTWHTISATALLSEYNPGMGLWKKMPHVMIEKCAEARALRRAFPADLSGLYTEEEMDQSVEVPTSAQVDTEKVISPSVVTDMAKYLAGQEDIRSGLLKICGVKNIEEIKESQLSACKQYIVAKLNEKNRVKS